MSSAAFSDRHLGVSGAELDTMAIEAGADSLEALVDLVVPAGIRRGERLELPEGLSEEAALERLGGMMGKNRVLRSLIGQGYSDCIVPPVVQRNILENPGWYTAYTPYQAEIAQGRLEALLNFQTMVCGLTGLDVANASLLDEGTAVAEAVAVAKAGRPKGDSVFLADGCHPQTVDVVRTRCEPLGIEVVVGDFREVPWDDRPELLAVVVQYPTSLGEIEDYSRLAETAKEQRALVIAACDLLSLTLLKPPGEWGADIAVGSAQRFGVPMGFGGPHAAFMAVRDGLKRKLPGRLVGVSRDAHGKVGFRLALQTREQHIRRDKATSNICTAQVLLAVMASMYAVYHGPDGLKAIARRINGLTSKLVSGLRAGGLTVVNTSWFDTIAVRGINAGEISKRAEEAGFNLRCADDTTVGISLDEKSSEDEVAILLGLFGAPAGDEPASGITSEHERGGAFLEEEVFNRFHTETEMLRYLRRLEVKDLALNTSMIPLGSCTMKLNATAEMMPLSWGTVAGLHPFVPADQAKGYAEMFRQLEWWLAKATGFAAVSLQPNAGSQGEFAGLMAIRRFHQANGESRRNVCLIPTSAHGTNPASAVMAGMRVVAVGCDEQGNIDVADLKAKAEANAMELSALMVTYPSTHGVFEESITEICSVVHRFGGQVYMDGANLNAQLGLTSPGICGADVCHLNLHKTFCIPHGGGGPGVGPIGVAEHLVEFLPGHRRGGDGMGSEGAVCSAPWGSASICTISWMYIAMMGGEGLEKATKVAILNANYIAKRLEAFFPVLYKGTNGFVAHECIIDLRPFKSAGIEVEDVAKRLIDYGFHSPTMSWPVPGTLMIEPTESESREELDRFCEAMISIYREIEAVRDGRADATDNVLKNAPHPAEVLCRDEWDHAYGREQAAFPLDWIRERKFWPAVGRIDNVYGDRNLVCSCAGMEGYRD